MAYLPPGSKLELCPVRSCQLVFSNTRAGDAHRVGEHGVTEGADRRRCLTRAEMAAKVIQGGKHRGEPFYRNRHDRWGNEVWVINTPGSPYAMQRFGGEDGAARQGATSAPQPFDAPAGVSMDAVAA